jgi:hypothetical protein
LKPRFALKRAKSVRLDLFSPAFELKSALSRKFDFRAKNSEKSPGLIPFSFCASLFLVFFEKTLFERLKRPLNIEFSAAGSKKSVLTRSFRLFRKSDKKHKTLNFTEKNCSWRLSWE